MDPVDSTAEEICKVGWVAVLNHSVADLEGNKP